MNRPSERERGGLEHPAGVVGAWAVASGRAAAVVAADLRDCVAGMAGPVDEQAELQRRWLALDWLVRAAAPRWLRAAGLPEHGARLRGLHPLGSPEALAVAASTVEEAALAAHHAHSGAWAMLADQAEPHTTGNDGSAVWAAVVDGAQVAVRATRTILDPAATAVGLPADPERGPAGWRATVAAITSSAAAIAWQATKAMTGWPAWTWETSPPVARGLTYLAARTALAPAEAATHGAACELLVAMHTYLEHHR